MLWRILCLRVARLEVFQLAQMRSRVVTTHPTPVSLATDWYAVCDCRMLDAPLSDDTGAHGQRERAHTS